MIQSDGYDWAAVFNRLTLSGATYGEVYLPSFWQTPGPSPELNHNTTERIAQLKAEIGKVPRERLLLRSPHPVPDAGCYRPLRLRRGRSWLEGRFRCSVGARSRSCLPLPCS